jgi:hypothetical protein
MQDAFTVLLLYPRAGYTGRRPFTIVAASAVIMPVPPFMVVVGISNVHMNSKRTSHVNLPCQPVISIITLPVLNSRREIRRADRWSSMRVEFANDLSHVERIFCFLISRL